MKNQRNNIQQTKLSDCLEKQFDLMFNKLELTHNTHVNINWIVPNNSSHQFISDITIKKPAYVSAILFSFIINKVRINYVHKHLRMRKVNVKTYKHYFRLLQVLHKTTKESIYKNNDIL